MSADTSVIAPAPVLGGILDAMSADAADGAPAVDLANVLVQPATFTDLEVYTPVLAKPSDNEDAVENANQTASNQDVAAPEAPAQAADAPEAAPKQNVAAQAAPAAPEAPAAPATPEVKPTEAPAPAQAAPEAPAPTEAPAPAAPEAPNRDSEAVLRAFDGLHSAINETSQLTARLHKQPHDEARVAALIKTQQQSQKSMEKLYELLVELNNFFGA